MADVQKEKGYTPIANDILEHLVKLPLNGTQWRIIIIVWRFTYGFSRKEHDISISFLLRALDLKESQYRQISRELGRLLDMGLLIETVSPDRNRTRRLMFQKDYDLWTKKTSDLIQPVNKKDMSDMPKKSIEPLDKLVQEDKQIIKTNLKSKDIDVFFEQLWILYPRKEGKGQISAAKKAKLYSIGIEEMTRAIERYKSKLDEGQTQQRFIKQGSTFFNSGYVDYLDANYSPTTFKGGRPDYADPTRYENQQW